MELRIESLAAGGDGVARGPDGRVVFVPDVAPGDFVRVTLVEQRPAFARGRVEALLERGPARDDPVCPVFGSCGGCVWQHVDYAAQLDAKARIIEDAIGRIAKLPVATRVPVVPSPSPYAYRGRARVLRSGGRTGFRRRRSRALCATDRCPVLLPPLEQALRVLARSGEEDGDWELMAGADGGVRVQPLSHAHGRSRRGGTGPLEIEVSGERLRVSPGVFVQSNALLLPRLVAEVAAAAGTGASALELYAGAGFFTLPLGRRFGSVVAVEASSAACRDLRRNVGRAGLANVRVIAGSVGSLLASSRLPADVDACVLDPPRRGLPPEGAEQLARLAPSRIVLLACDPATGARDLGRLARHGYTLDRVLGFDLFPQTPHVELLAVLRAPSTGPA